MASYHSSRKVANTSHSAGRDPAGSAGSTSCSVAPVMPPLPSLASTWVSILHWPQAWAPFSLTLLFWRPQVMENFEYIICCRFRLLTCLSSGDGTRGLIMGKHTFCFCGSHGFLSCFLCCTEQPGEFKLQSFAGSWYCCINKYWITRWRGGRGIYSTCYRIRLWSSSNKNIGHTISMKIPNNTELPYNQAVPL